MVLAEKSGDILAAIGEVFRTFHSIKGGAQLVGCTMLAEFAHHVEDLLDHVRSGRRPADSQIASLVLQSLDLMEEEIECYRQYEVPEALSGRQDKLLQLAKSLAPGAGTQTVIRPAPKPSPATPRCEIVLPEPAAACPAPPVALDCGGRLVYSLFLIDTDAPMPEITEFLIRQRLAEAGTVVYVGKPDSLFLSLEAIIRTALDDQELRRHCNAADITAIHLKELSPVAFHLGLLPHAAVEEFIGDTQKLSRLFNDENSPIKAVSQTLQQIIDWGDRYIAASGCFAGGPAEWNRAVDLIQHAVNLWPSLRSKAEQRILYELLLQNLWEWVYASLCNKIYFFELRPSSLTQNPGLLPEIKSLIKGGSPRVFIIDLSEVEILEPAEIKALQEAQAWLDKRNIDMKLVATGDFRHRHQNTLEALTSVLPSMQLHSSPYQALLKSEEIPT